MTTEFCGLSEDDVLQRIEEGMSVAAIAAECKRGRAQLWRWLQATPERADRTKASRTIAAAAWDDLAESTIREAKDAHQLSQAKELAHHYRWRAAKIAPKDYGDKVEHEHKGSVSIVATSQDERL